MEPRDAMDVDLIKKFLRALTDADVEYVLIGGVAMAVHGLVRATEDIDLFVRPTSDNVARLRTALSRVWDDPNILDITADDLGGDYPAIRYAPPEGDVVVDLVSRLGEAFRFEDLAVEDRDFEDVTVHVATPGTLYRMKRDTVRPVDRLDATRLRDRFPSEVSDAG